MNAVTACGVGMKVTPKWCTWPFLPSASVCVCLHSLINEASCGASHLKTRASLSSSRVYLSFSLCSLVFFNSEYYLFKVTHCHPRASINLILQAGRGNGLCAEKNPTFYEVRVNFKAACPTHQQPTMDGVYSSQLLLA